MKRIILFSMLAIMNMFLAKAQSEKSTANSTIISGIVLEAGKLDTLSFATVSIEAILENDKKVVQYRQVLKQVTDQKGRFSIAVVPASRYIVEAMYNGMKTKKMELNKIEQNKNNFVRIEMEADATQLGEVVVQRDKNPIKLELDRISYDMQKDPEVSTKTVFDMLRKIPLVTINGQDEIQIGGSSSFSVFLNDKPNPMFANRPQDVLKTMPAAMVKKIEVITDPGVKYSAEIQGAILNIVTEQSTSAVGYKGSVNMNADTWHRNRYRASTSISINRDKWGISSSLSGYLNFRNEQDAISDRYINNKLSSRNIDNTSKTLDQNYRLNTNMYYTPTEQDLLSMHINLSIDPYAVSHRYTDLEDFENKTKYILHRKDTTNENSINLNLDYQHTFKGTNDFFTLSYLFSRSTERNQIYNYIGENAETFTNAYDPQNLKFLQNTLQADYSFEFAKINKIETGLKFNSKYNYSDEIQKDALLKITQSNNYNLIDNILAAYMVYSLKYNAFTLKAGFRGEYIWSKLDQFMANKATKFTRSNFDWVPNLSLAYNINQTTLIKLHYDYYIKRPNIWDLNPNEKMLTNTLVSRGNPKLEAEKKHNIMSEFKTYTKGFVVQGSLGYSFSNNKITQLWGQEDDKIVWYKDNVGRSDAMNTSLYFAYTGWGWLQPSINANYSLTKYAGISDLKYNYSISPSLQVYAPWGLSAYAYAFLFSAKEYTMNIEASGGYGAGINKNFMDGKINLGLGINIFPKHYSGSVVENANGVMTKFKTVNHQNAVTIQFSYNFGEMKTKAKKTNKTLQSEAGSSGGGFFGN